MLESTLIYISPGKEAALSDPDREVLQNCGVFITNQCEAAIKAVEEENRFVTLIVCADEPDLDALRFIRASYARLNSLADLQVIVADDPSMNLQGLAHEFGVRNFWGANNIATRLQSWITTHQSNMEADSGGMAKLLKLGVAVASRNWKEIEGVIASLEEDAKSDFRLANILGQFHLAQQNNAKAEQAFLAVKELNPLFIPALSSLANAKLASAKPEEALGILKSLELFGDTNPDRKALMASACADLGRWEESVEHMNAAAKLDPKNDHVAEMRARALFHSGKVDEAIKLLETCHAVDEYFLTKLNEEAIVLAKASQTDSAMRLYIVTHKLAPKALKYKISYNIALGYKRGGKNAEALKYAQIAKQESPIANPEKIIALIESLK